MDNQHRNIRGYRDLTQREINLMNEAKELEAKVLEFHGKVLDELEASTVIPEERDRQVASHAFRWHRIARTDLETGFMALVRSIAQPQPK